MTIIDSKTLGAQLKEIRVEKKVSITTLAYRLDIDHSTITKWETGVNKITAVDMIRYLNALDYSLNDFAKRF